MAGDEKRNAMNAGTLGVPFNSLLQSSLVQHQGISKEEMRRRADAQSTMRLALANGKLLSGEELALLKETAEEQHDLEERITEGHVLNTDELEQLKCYAEAEIQLSKHGVYEIGPKEFRVISPKPIGGLGGERIVMVAAGDRHSAALTADGQLFAWGDGGKGQIGLGELERHVWTPQRVPAFSSVGIVWIGCGESYTACLTSVGHVICFGDNSEGQCAQGAACELALRPNALGGMLQQRPTRMLAVGAAHVVALIDPPPADADGLLSTFDKRRTGALTPNDIDVSQVKSGLRKAACRVPDHLDPVKKLELARNFKANQPLPLPPPPPPLAPIATNLTEAALTTATPDFSPSMATAPPLPPIPPADDEPLSAGFANAVTAAAAQRVNEQQFGNGGGGEGGGEGGGGEEEMLSLSPSTVAQSGRPSPGVHAQEGDGPPQQEQQLPGAYIQQQQQVEEPIEMRQRLPAHEVHRIKQERAKAHVNRLLSDIFDRPDNALARVEFEYHPPKKPVVRSKQRYDKLTRVVSSDSLLAGGCC